MSLIRVFASIAVAVLVAVLIEWQLTRYPYHVPFFVGDFVVRVLGCAIGLTVSRFLWDRYRYFVISGVILFYVLIDAPRIYPYFPFDRIDWYPFKFLPLMWAKIAWFTASVGVTVIGAMIGELVGRLLRRRFVVYSARRSRSSI